MVDDGLKPAARANVPAPAKKVVVAALLWRGNALLVAQRPTDKPLGGLWEFPGGKCEPGEAEDQALVRELGEELGVGAQVGPCAWRAEHAGGAPFALHFYHARLMDDHAEPQPLASQRVAWCAPQDLGRLPFCPADAGLVAALAAGTVAPWDATLTGPDER